MTSEQLGRVAVSYKSIALCVVIGITFAGCATVPTGPNVRVMPAAGKPFEVFQADNSVCMDFARQQIGKDPNALSREQALTGAVAGAALGAAAGALMGHGNTHAVASGAAVGGLLGTAVGASESQANSMTLQQRYDNAYQQCMYAKGNQVPGYTTPAYTPPPPLPSAPPPPPSAP